MAIFMFVSEYYFLEPGIKRVLKLFDAALERKKKVKDLTSQYTEVKYCKISNSWIINASDETGLEVYKVLHEILIELVVSEIGDDFDDNVDGQNIESRLIQREGLQSSVDDGSYEEISDTSVGVPTWEFKTVWHCLPVEELNYYGEDFLDKMLCGNGLSTIEMMTGTKLSIDYAMHVINVQSRSEEAMNRAVCKLDTIRNSLKFLNFLVHHVFYTESFNDFQIVALPFQEIKKKIVQTTILDHTKLMADRRRQLSNNHDQEVVNRNTKIKRFYTLRCGKWEPTRLVYHLQAPKKLIRAVAEEMTQVKSTIWKDYEYHDKGGEMSRLMRQLPEGLGNGSTQRAVTAKDEMIADWAQGLPNINQMIDAIVHGDNSSAALHVGRHSQDGTGTAPMYEFRSEASFTNPPDLHHPSLLDGSPTKHPELQMPLSPRNVGSQAASISSLALLQQDEVVSTRTLQNTVRQKATRHGLHEKDLRPSPLPTPAVSSACPVQVADPISKFARDFRSSTYDMLRAMRTWGGEVKLELQLGRIFFRKIAPQLKDGKMKSPEYVLPYLPAEVAGASKQVSFTKIVTSLPADAQHLIELKDSQDRPLWQSKLPPKWDVFYEIDCELVGSNIPFQVRVDAETFVVQVQSAPSLFGVMYSHCLLRNWDFRVAATGVMDETTSFKDFALELQESLCVRSSAQRPTLSFKCKHEHGIQPMYVRVRRTLHYPGFDHKTILHVCESQHMVMDASVIPEAGKTVYKATPAAVKMSPSDAETLWHEISITSAEADKAFKENEKLEYGEEVRWSVKGMEERGVPDALMRAATSMVRQMDGVGWYNDNGQRTASMKDDDQTTSSVNETLAKPSKYGPAKAMPPKVEGEYSYW